MSIKRAIYFDGCVICGRESFGAHLCSTEDCAIRFECMQIVAEMSPNQQPRDAGKGE